MGSSYRNTLNNWLATLDVKADRLLDIGGSQESLKGRTRSFDVKEYIVADLPSPHKDSPKPDIELDVNEIWHKGDHRNSYDLVFCLEVMDYIWNPVTALTNIRVFLKEGGTAWVTFPSVYPLHQPIEDDALRYMPGGITKLAESVGLEIVQMIKRRPESDLWLHFISAERLRAAKHEDHNFTGFIVQFKKRPIK